MPYLEEDDLYAQFDQTKAWDDPANRYVLEHMPEVFRGSPDRPCSTARRPAGVFGPSAIFAGAQGTTIGGISDGSSNTLMVGEAARADIPWTEPADVDVTLHPSLGDRPW